MHGDGKGRRLLRSKVAAGLKPAAAMAVAQFLFAALQILYKLALDDGMDVRVLVAYRFMFASALLCPVAFLIERKERPPLTRRVLLHLFLCALFGFAINQNLYVFAIKLTSTTFTSALSNLTPATTFLLAIFSRLETLQLKKPPGQAKLLGTLVSLGGAMLLTFYKGPELRFLRLPRLGLVAPHAAHGHGAGSVTAGHRVIGSFLSVASCFSYAIWLIIQAKVSEVYPCHYSIAAMVCLFSAVQTTVLAACTHRDMEGWRIGLNIRLYSAAYAGIVASASAFPLVSWCIRKKGPLYVAVFSPLMLIIVAVMSSVVLDESLHLGSVLGAVLIVCGLYLVLWGKGREETDVLKELNKESIPEVLMVKQDEKNLA